MDFAVGLRVTINKCDVCPGIVGKTARIVGLTSAPGFEAAELSFGRGRPQANRPKIVGLKDISLIKE